MTSASRTITADNGDRLPNVHPGEILREDFLIGGQLPLEEVSLGSGVSADMLRALLDERARVDAETDLRLARYLGMSAGFLLGLQHHYDIEAARDAHRDALDRIVPRAA